MIKRNHDACCGNCPYWADVPPSVRYKGREDGLDEWLKDVTECRPCCFGNPSNGDGHKVMFDYEFCGDHPEFPKQRTVGIGASE